MQQRVRVLTYNIHKGFTSGNRRFVLDRIREAIREVRADLVFLQEVLGRHDGHQSRIREWPGEPQFEYLADSLWPHYAYGRNSVYTGGHHGNAILSRFPIMFSENTDISTNQLERRGLLHALIDVPGQRLPLHVICVHLGLLEAERQSQVRQICARLREQVKRQEPLIIGGDFNDWRARITPPFRRSLGVSECFQSLHGGHARTFPSWLPALPLDRIYCRGLKPESARCLSGRPWSQLSDHAALFSELTFSDST